MLTVSFVQCRKDNYVWLARDSGSGEVVVIDPTDAAPVMAALDALDWRPTAVWNTHHHGDHTGGNAELKARYGCAVFAPAAELSDIPTADYALQQGDVVKLGTTEAVVIDVPGHTRGHIAYHLPADRVLFCGDTLFALGCGRLFEGTAAQMWQSLQKLMELPPQTHVYCAHEYTESNLRFAQHVMPQNEALKRRAMQIAQTRAAGKPTVPSLLSVELATNPFLRADQPELRAALGDESQSGEVVFAMLRKMKDEF